MPPAENPMINLIRQCSRLRVVLPILFALVGLGLWASVSFGTENLANLPEQVSRTIRYEIRLPRALCAAIVGIDLAVAGVLLQAVMRNPLAAPNIIGVTAGAGLAATVVLVLIPEFTASLPDDHFLRTNADAILPAGAFIGAMAAGLTVYALSYRPGSGASPIRMVLAGIAITAMLGAITTYLLIAYPDRNQAAIQWLSGSLNGRGWDQVHFVKWYSIAALVAVIPMIPSLDALRLGDDAARGLGVRVEFVRFSALALACLLAASAVSVAGNITFIGLIIPHMLRFIVGSRHLVLIPAAALGGAALLLYADLGARTVQKPQELPVGMITALLGGPYFIFLIMTTRSIR